eukprot:SAG11_NODE_36093_length_263_cov_0.932927_1_plen_21_part_01
MVELQVTTIATTRDVDGQSIN